jgi:uncharacterized protein
MLRVDLGRLAREGSVLVEAQVPADDGLWQESGIRWAGPVDVRLRASYAGTGEVVVRGTVRGRLEQECRRCLRPVMEDFDDELTLVFVSDATGEDTDEGDAFVYDARGGALDLTDAVREEVILAMNPYVVCDPQCAGLCPRCGKNRNDGPCQCAEEEVDPRWEALRALKGR